MFCSKCGREIPERSKFCSYCGAELASEAKELIPKGHGWSKTIIIPLIVIVGILLCAFAFFKLIKPAVSSKGQKEELATLIPYRAGDKWGYCDWNKKLVIKPTYEIADCFREDLARVLLNKKWGFIDRKGRMVIEPIYDDAYGFTEGLAAVELNDKWGYIDKKGRMVIEEIGNKANL